MSSYNFFKDDSWAYSILGIDQSIKSPHIISVRFQELTKTQHPSVGGDKDMWGNINVAYEYLLQKITNLQRSALKNVSSYVNTDGVGATGATGATGAITENFEAKPESDPTQRQPYSWLNSRLNNRSYIYTLLCIILFLYIINDFFPDLYLSLFSKFQSVVYFLRYIVPSLTVRLMMYLVLLLFILDFIGIINFQNLSGQSQQYILDGANTGGSATTRGVSVLNNYKYYISGIVTLLFAILIIFRVYSTRNIGIVNQVPANVQTSGSLLLRLFIVLLIIMAVGGCSYFLYTHGLNWITPQPQGPQPQRPQNQPITVTSTWIPSNFQHLIVPSIVVCVSAIIGLLLLRSLVAPARNANVIRIVPQNTSGGTGFLGTMLILMIFCILSAAGAMYYFSLDLNWLKTVWQSARPLTDDEKQQLKDAKIRLELQKLYGDRGLPYEFQDTGFKITRNGVVTENKHCSSKAGSNNFGVCQTLAKKSCQRTLEGEPMEPCYEILFQSCNVPTPVDPETSKNCEYLAQIQCEDEMTKCQAELEVCKMNKASGQSTQQCKNCGDLRRCVEMKTKQCEKQSECWDSFLEFLKRISPSNYAEIWHTLKANNITTQEQLINSIDPIKEVPWFLGQKDSDKYTLIKNAIMNAKRMKLIT